ncbi:helix-turn-helix domain-containing protein [Amycolatopsis alba]|uniref:IclR family transcriptional regulator n=1 Tax=Amycolatopsis alba DSM 44262 TaxID=1125972 RepID=A0A229RFP8_AMYAL|nr:helix-turn-helix domain-containing protein [Amycolatopsis alba]OXM45214.1 IclR family transcriptional regulator [Amycolatopsis alba DSM 44262]
MRYRQEAIRGDIDKTGGRGVLEGAFLLLDELATVGEAGLTRLAAGAGLPKSTTHRLLSQLVELGAVQRRSGRYRIGPRTLRLGAAWPPGRVLRTAALGPMRQLAAATGASVRLNVFLSDEHRGLPNLWMYGEADRPWPAPGHRTHPAGSLSTAPTSNQITSAAFAQFVAELHGNHVALDNRQPDRPVFAVIATVRAPSGRIVAAISAGVLDDRRLSSLTPAVQRAARLASANLARHPAVRPG